MSEMCWIDLKCLSVCCGWDLNYANCLRTCNVATVYVLWRNYDLNDFKVFDEMLDLFSFKGTWFTVIKHILFRHRACSIEHTYNSSTIVTEPSK
jgi:hypothetical protein